MRKIAFRAWDKEKKKWLHSNDFWVKGDGRTFGYKYATGRSTIILENVDLMQFTGLKDKNGKEIYEGDIITTTHKRADTFEIIYENKYARFAIDNHYGDTYDMAQSEFVGNRFEVIGNIWENEELLSSEE